ncbi:MAG: hypothetical protein V4623_11030 [Pseudomonadota bacterium]
MLVRSVCFLKKSPILTFVLMGLAFIGFGLASLNLLYLLQANMALILEYGAMVLLDGALQQLLELLGLGTLGLACYLLFKVCEKILVERLSGADKA